MSRPHSIDEFRLLSARLRAGRDDALPTIVIPAGTCGRASGANELILAVKRQLLLRALTDRVRLRVTGCHGFCEMEPSVLIEPSGTFYPKVSVAEMEQIVDAVVEGRTLPELLTTDPHTGDPVPHQDDIAFFRKQRRTVLAGNEQVDPTRIYSYIACGGYDALVKVLSAASPDAVVAEVKASGLRGRGGGGFPTGLKWEMLARQSAQQGKFVVCNADEGDPGAYMDRSVLEGNPHSIIEGMLIGAYGTGANQGIVYVRHEYPLAIEHLSIALRQAREHGLLGADILGTGFAFDIQLVQGAGAFVCGEETALIRSIEGQMGEPRQRPPYPIQRGIHGRPTIINNVETWANIPVIIRQGAQQFAQVGTPGNAGTKIFSLVGRIKRTGLVEVPMGITVREIVYDIGGGPVGRAKIKAVQTGGPSGGCIPASAFDLPIDYDSLAAAGSIMGSGGMIVMDDTTCMVDVAKYFMKFLKDESCGKCFTCRKGTQRMYEILDDISNGCGTPAHLTLLEELARVVKDTTMCGLGQTAANPVLSTLRHFRGEYERHVIDKRCDAFVCTNLIGAPCQTACPVDTQAWRYVALIGQNRYEEAYQVIRQANPLPSICARVCDRKCEQHCQLGTSGGQPTAIRSLKRFVTDRVDPAVYQPVPVGRPAHETSQVAVVGGGPAGLSAAHYLSLLGHAVTLFEAEDVLGGMLVSGIPAYRLPRDVLRQEIASLLNDHITVRYGQVLGRDITVDGLLADGYRAVFVAIGADQSTQLGLAGETVAGVYTSMQFLKAFNLRGEELAGGHVGIIGGGNSAVDAARVAMRQENVESVTLLYRRTDQEMPAYAEEVEAALEEGVRLETLVSPVKIRHIGAAVREGVKVETMISPIRIHAQAGRLVGIECIRNRLGEPDASGRCRPVPIPGSEFQLALNTLIVAIGERPDSECLARMGLELDAGGRLRADRQTFGTSRPGVFAGGDVVTGPYTVVDAIAAGKNVAAVIDRYLRGQPLAAPAHATVPDVFVEPTAADDAAEEAGRAEPATLPCAARRRNFAEVELGLTPEEAVAEAHRCLRCDLKFTRRQDHAEAVGAAARGASE